jgi:hypothetical protein
MEAVKHYMRLCWFDINPLAIEKSAGFLRLNLMFYALIQYFLQSKMTEDPFESFFEVIFELLFTFVFVGAMLVIDKKRSAFIQVSTAILFCTNVITIFVVPVIIWVTVTDDPLSYYLMCLLVLWFFALITQIIRQALAIDMQASLALSLLFFIVIYGGSFGLGQLIM